jgi:4-hydroxy-4-methyl-2-oxoglutarate aldolase
MIEEPPILTIARTMRRPDDRQIAAFQGVPTGFVADAMDGSGALSNEIRLVADHTAEPAGAAGPALTVDCGPADILALLAALNYIRPGDVVVNAFGGHQGCAAVGDRVTGMIRNNGAAGLVTDGPARDITGVLATGLPVWCTGTTPASPFSTGPGTVGLPVQIGGRQVETGDMVVADRDGVVIVPFARIDEVIERLAHVRKLEHDLDAEVAKGLKIPPAIEELLASDKVRFTD